MLFADDIVLVDESRDGVERKLLNKIYEKEIGLVSY